jgi:hypothetical protein
LHQQDNLVENFDMSWNQIDGLTYSIEHIYDPICVERSNRANLRTVWQNHLRLASPPDLYAVTACGRLAL